MVFKNSDNFVKLFLASIIIGPGIKVYGYPLIDEYWMSMLLIGLFMRKIMITNVAIQETEKKTYNFHEKAFILLTFYFLFQSFRGGLWLEDLRMLRWVIFFIIVGLSFFIFSNYKQSIDPEHVIKTVIFLSTIYFLIYFLSGYIYELLTGMSKFDLQDDFVAGSSTATFPVIIYLIAIMLFFENRKTTVVNLFIVLSFIIVSWTVVYYDSRSAIFSILSFLVLNFLFQIFGFKAKKSKSPIFLMIIFYVIYQIWVFYYSDSSRTIKSFLPIDDELNFVVPKNFSSGDASRILAPKIALNLITENPFHTFFGYGWYMSRYEMIEPIREMRKMENMLRLNLSKEKPYQSSGVIAIMVDTGFIGIILYLLNLLLGLSAILKTQNNSKYIISLAYLSIGMWSFVGTITPLLLFYFWVMPNNPIILMLKEEKEKELYNYTK